MWGIESEDRHRDDLAPGDLALIYVAGADGSFIGRAELATPVHEWEPSEANAYPGDSTSGVAFSDVELWDRAVPMAFVVGPVDPAASNPVVRANAQAGFRIGVVRITGDEYGDAVAASRDYQRT